MSNFLQIIFTDLQFANDDVWKKVIVDVKDVVNVVQTFAVAHFATLVHFVVVIIINDVVCQQLREVRTQLKSPASRQSDKVRRHTQWRRQWQWWFSDNENQRKWIYWHSSWWVFYEWIFLNVIKFPSKKLWGLGVHSKMTI